MIAGLDDMDCLKGMHNDSATDISPASARVGAALRLLSREAARCASPMLCMAMRLACMLCTLPMLPPLSSRAFVRSPGPSMAACKWGIC